MARRSSRTIGRTRIRLARLLGEALSKERDEVITVKPERLTVAQGWYRTSNSYQNEALRWEGWADIEGMTIGIRVMSYCPMTRILASGGITLTQDGPTSYDVDEAVPSDHEPCHACGASIPISEAACVYCGVIKPREQLAATAPTQGGEP